MTNCSLCKRKEKDEAKANITGRCFCWNCIQAGEVVRFCLGCKLNFSPKEIKRIRDTICPFFLPKKIKTEVINNG